MAAHALPARSPRFPILALLHPRERSWLVLAALLLALGIGTLGVRVWGWPLWWAAVLGRAQME
jgi:hypothetical protein